MSNRRRPKRPAYGHKERKPHDFVPVQTPTYWNGEPTLCVRGTAVITNVGEMFGAREPVVLVDANPPHVLLDRGGQGWMKVTIGFGGPRYGHQNVTIDRSTFVATK